MIQLIFTEKLKDFFLHQHKDKITLLTDQLREERKKIEDLQFSIDEQAISAEESDVSLLHNLKSLHV